MTIYFTGNVSINNLSNTVSGTGTNWTTSGLMPNWLISFDNYVSWYEIESIISDIEIILYTPYIGENLENVSYAAADISPRVSIPSLIAFTINNASLSAPSTVGVLWNDNGVLSVSIKNGGNVLTDDYGNPLTDDYGNVLTDG